MKQSWYSNLLDWLCINIFSFYLLIAAIILGLVVGICFVRDLFIRKKTGALT